MSKRRSNKETLAKAKNKYAWVRGGRKKHEKPQNFKGTLGKLVRYIKPHMPKLMIVLAASLVVSALNVYGPKLLGTMIDIVSGQIVDYRATKVWNSAPVMDLLKKLLIIYGGAGIFGFVQQYILAGITQEILRTMRAQVNGKISRLPLRYFDQVSKGEILSRMMNDIDNMSKTVQNNIVRILGSCVNFIGAGYMMCVYSWQLTSYSALILPFTLPIVWMIARRSKRYFRQQWDRTGELNGHIEEMFTGHMLVKVFNHEAKSVAEFDDINNELGKVSHRAQFISGMIGPILGFIGNFSLVLLCVIGGNFVVKGTFAIGDITSFFIYTRMFIQPILDFGGIVNALQSSLASAERVFTLLEEEEEPADSPLHQIDKPSGAVRFEDVSFRYVEEKPLIDGLNLDIAPGELIAIVGPTGAGKTTIVNLLMRFYDVTGGRITVDGCDIRDITRENLRNIFGMVLQDTWLFNGTIYDNIAYGRLGASEEEVHAAAKAARVEHFLELMPDGIYSQLEEDGGNISQGQRQLITIARALLADPAILILDEATSSVDTRTEILIQQATQTLMEGRTSFVIAHRLSTIRNADCILVMNEGGIVETGTHSELIALGGFYTEIYNSQFGLAGNMAIIEE